HAPQSPPRRYCLSIEYPWPLSLDAPPLLERRPGHVDRRIGTVQTVEIIYVALREGNTVSRLRPGILRRRTPTTNVTVSKRAMNRMAESAWQCDPDIVTVNAVEANTESFACAARRDLAGKQKPSVAAELQKTPCINFFAVAEECLSAHRLMYPGRNHGYV